MSRREPAEKPETNGDGIVARHFGDLAEYGTRYSIAKCFPADFCRVAGVEEVSVCSYHIDIRKGLAFSWEEIDPEVKLVLGRYAPKPAKDVSP